MGVTAGGSGANLACEENTVSISEFISKQFIRVIQWNESGDGALSYRYPMADMEIENGGQ